MTTSIPPSSPETSSRADNSPVGALIGDLAAPGGGDAAAAGKTDFSSLLDGQPAGFQPTASANTTGTAGVVSNVLRALQQMVFAAGQGTEGIATGVENFGKTAATDDTAPAAGTQATTDSTGPSPASKRDVAEAIAALVASFLNSISPQTPVSTVAADATNQPAGSPGSAKVTMNFGGQSSTALTLELPTASGPDAALDAKAFLQSLPARISEAIESALEQGSQSLPAGSDANSAATGNSPMTAETLSATIELSGSLAASVSQENFAGQNPLASAATKFGKSGKDRNFLDTEGELVTKAKRGAGIDSALADDTMPATFTSHRLTIEPMAFSGNPVGRNITAAIPMPAPVDSKTLSQTDNSVSTPALAHRAVETVLNVVESQADSSGLGHTVNLHFNFAGDNLSVRVQLRGGEVQTRFLTDSTDLRSSLATEWRALSGRSSLSGLRLADPVFASSSSGGSGTGSQGQQSNSQQNPQHSDRAFVALPELRALRRSGSTNVSTPAAQSAPAVRVSAPNSLHLAAVA
jgi:hypothetical protein